MQTGALVFGPVLLPVLSAIAMTRPIRVLIADDHPVVREGVAAMLGSRAGFECVGQAECVEQVIELWQRLRPDVGLFDLRMPDGDAVGAITRIRQDDPDARIIVLSTYDGEEDVYRVLKAGAKGYMLKDSSQQVVLDGIRAVHQGQTHVPTPIAAKLASRLSEEDLSEREIEILKQGVSGATNKQIARVLGISPSTVKFHLNNAYGKLGVTTRTAAISIAAKRGLVSLD